MSGAIEIIIAAVVTGTAVIAAWTDLRQAKVYNWLTLPVLLVGVAFQFLVLGVTPGIDALWAVALAWVCLGWMYALRFMAAGDVKLLMAFGAWLGTERTVEVALLSVFIGGVLASIQLILHGKFLDFMRRAWLFSLSFLVRELKHVRPELDQKLKLPFGVALALAAVFTLFFHPLRVWQVLPW